MVTGICLGIYIHIATKCKYTFTFRKYMRRYLYDASLCPQIRLRLDELLEAVVENITAIGYDSSTVS